MLSSKIDEIIKDAGSSTIVAATKYVDIDTMNELLDKGITNFGENRVEAFVRKHIQLEGKPITWHFIGHLQRNKAKLLANDIDYLHSLDSLELAKILNEKRTKPLMCFVEILLSDSETKHGIAEEDLGKFLEDLKQFDKISVVGLMAMTEKQMSHDEKLELFKHLVDLGHKYNLRNFSMGMSGDYKEALEAGATHIRLGRILFNDNF